MKGLDLPDMPYLVKYFGFNTRIMEKRNSWLVSWTLESMNPSNLAWFLMEHFTSK